MDSRTSGSDTEDLRPLGDSSDLIGDVERLDAVYREEGYLFLRGVLPLDEVERVRLEVLAGLADQGFVRSGAGVDELRLTRAEDIDMERLHAVVGYRRLYTHPQSMSFFEQLLGEPVWPFRSVQIRCMPPAETWSLAPSHQDANYIGPNDDFRTVWTPLTTVTADMGGFGLVPGSHTSGVLPTVETERQRSDGSKGPNHLTIPDEAITGVWAAPTRIDPGDIVMFHSCLVHRSLPNRSTAGRIRLSLDTRIQPSRSPRGASASYTAPELERLVLEQGLDAMKQEVVPGPGRVSL